MKYQIKRYDMRKHGIDRDWIYGPIRWLVYLDAVHVETFSTKQEAIEWIMKKEFPK